MNGSGDPISDLEALRRSPGDPEDRNRGARERLVAAGGWLLLERGRENLDEILSVQRVVRRAGASRQSWHNHFGGADYVDALIEWCVDLETTRQAIDFFEAATEFFAGLDDPRMSLTQVVDLCAGVFEMARADPSTRLQLIVATLAPDDATAAAALRGRYDLRCEGTAPGFRRIFESAGYAPRPPHDYRSVAEAIAALGDGFMVRSLLEPDGPWAERFALAVAAFLTGALSPAAVDGEPTTAADQVFPITPSAEVRVLAPPSEATLAAVEVALRAHASVAISLDKVAAELGCPVSVLESRYGSADALVASAWRRYVVDDVELAAHAPLAPGKLVRHVVETLAECSLHHWWLTASSARARLDRVGRAGEPHTSRIVTLLGRALQDARAATLVGERSGPSTAMTDDDLARLARRLEESVLAEVLSTPELPTGERDARREQIVADVWDSLLVGIKPRR